MIPLLKQGIAERNLLKFDTGMYLFQPMRSLILFIVAIVMFLFQYALPQPAMAAAVFHFVPSAVWLTLNIVLFLEIPLALLLERVNWRAYFGLILLPLFLWTWGPVTLQAYFTKTNRKWYHTVHRRAIRLDEMSSR